MPEGVHVDYPLEQRVAVAVALEAVLRFDLQSAEHERAAADELVERRQHERPPRPRAPAPAPRPQPITPPAPHADPPLEPQAAAGGIGTISNLMRSGHPVEPFAMLIIRQEGKGQPYRFRVERVGAGGVKSAPAVELNSPLERRLEGTQLTLGAELQWYLEDYFCYPFPPITERADRVRG